VRSNTAARDTKPSEGFAQVLRNSLGFNSSGLTGFSSVFFRFETASTPGRRSKGWGSAKGNFTPGLEAQTKSSSLTVREVHRVPDSFCLEEMTAFVAGYDLQSGPDRETNSRG
jgi:hypothetical protein